MGWCQYGLPAEVTTIKNPKACEKNAYAALSAMFLNGKLTSRSAVF